MERSRQKKPRETLDPNLSLLVVRVEQRNLLEDGIGQQQSQRKAILHEISKVAFANAATQPVTVVVHHLHAHVAC